MPRLATVGDAFALIGRGGFAHLHANEPCVRLERNSEGIHQLRVSVRRLRSALALYRDFIPARERRDCARRLKWIAKQCAQAREWDVFCDEFLDPLRKVHPDEPALGDFAIAARKLRLAADARVAKVLAGAPYARNILKAETWWDNGNWRSTANDLAAEKALHFSRARIRKFHRRLCKRLKHVKRCDERALHELRIRTKKLRYAIDFFGGLFPSKAVGPYRAVLVEIQDCLGALNDIAATPRLSTAVEKNARALDAVACARAIRLIGAWNVARQKLGVNRLPGLSRRFAKLRPFWE